MRTCCALLSLALLTGCATAPRVGGDPDLKVLEGSELPPPDREDLTGQSKAYFVGPYDRLSIGVYGIPEMADRDVQVDAAGGISFPNAGSLEVAGRTPSEIAEMLAARLRANYVRNPQVTVNLKESMSRSITVEGEVKSPGIYPVIGKMTLLRAIARAASTTEFSKLDDVVVFRTVGGQRLAGLYNLKLIRRGAYADPEIFGNDVVVVGDARARRVFKDVLQSLPILTAPLIIALDRIAR